jgi:GH25 family lysozyme M1 (1,4-beta-N-acetylmuramidase)
MEAQLAIIDALDWSHYQKFVNFERLKRATIEGRPVRRAFVRAGQGTTPDGFFARNWAGLREMGWRRGSYWVSDPSVRGVEQARKYWEILKPEQGDYRLAPDLELPDIRGVPVTKAQKANHWAFVLELEQLCGYTPMIYSRATWLDPMWEGEDYSRFAFWGAGYPTLLIPKGWKRAAMHQYTSKGRMDGIEGNVDFNYILDEDAILLPSKAQTLPDKFPIRATTSRAAIGYRKSSGQGDTLMSVDLAGVGLTVHDIDTEKRTALASVNDLRAWYPLDAINLDVPKPEPQPVPPQPVTPTPQPIKLGYNCLNAGMAMAKADAGCRFFMLQDVSVARQIKRKYPDAVVMVRWYHGQRVTPDDVVRGLSPSLDDELVFTGLNECDWLCYGTIDQLRERAAFDVAMAQRIKERSPKSVYAAGTFSVGTPDFTSAGICEAMRQLYAQHYNSGLMSIDYHSYTPSLTSGFDVWYARRWQWLFDKCGFDVNSTSRIYSGETGVDDGKGHGFTGVGATQAQVNDWVIRFKALQSEPINGKPSPFVGGAVFCLGENGDRRWLPFKADGYEVIR